MARWYQSLKEKIIPGRSSIMCKGSAVGTGLLEDRKASSAQG